MKKAIFLSENRKYLWNGAI